MLANCKTFINCDEQLRLSAQQNQSPLRMSSELKMKNRICDNGGALLVLTQALGGKKPSK